MGPVVLEPVRHDWQSQVGGTTEDHVPVGGQGIRAGVKAIQGINAVDIAEKLQLK